MNVKINDLMSKRVITAEPHHTVERLRGLMERNRIHAVPIVGPAGEAVGVVSTADLSADLKPGTPAKGIMNVTVRTVPAYNNVDVAARIMRRHKIHHVVVTHEKKVVGVISSFDLLKLVEQRRFVMKEPPGSAKTR